MTGKPKGDVIIALDFPSAADVYGFLAQFEQEKPYVKIGMELYYAEGPQIVRASADEAVEVRELDTAVIPN